MIRLLPLLLATLLCAEALLATPPPPVPQPVAGVTVPAEPALSTRIADALRHRAESCGRAGPAVYALLWAIATALWVPGWILSMGAGATFGFTTGVVSVYVGSMLSCTFCFLASRHLIRHRVERWVAERPRLQRLDAAVARHGWQIVALSRLSPVFPFTLINYSFGITGVRLTTFTAVNLIGVLPGAIIYTYTGATAVDLMLSTGGSRTQLLKLAAFVLGLGATAAATHLARRLLRASADVPDVEAPR